MHIDALIELVRPLVAPPLRMQLTAESALLRGHFLDSFGVLELLERLETHFGIQIPFDEITEADLQTVRTISALLVRLVDK